MTIVNREQYGANTVPSFLVVPVKANAVIDQGNLVCLDSTGYAILATEATNLLPVGRAEESVDATGLSSGAITIKCRLGAFKFKNSAAGDTIGVTELLKNVYVVNGETMAKTDNSGARSVGGKVLAVESDGVIVSIGPR